MDNAIDYRFLLDLIKNMPSEEEQIELDAEKTRQEFEELIRKDPLLHNAYTMYMNYPLSEEHLYQKIILELVHKAEKQDEMIVDLMSKSTRPSFIK